MDSRIKRMLLSLVLLVAACGPKSGEGSDAGPSDTAVDDSGGPEDSWVTGDGIAVAFVEETVLLDHGVLFMNPTQPTLFESYLWSYDERCDTGTPAVDFTQMFLTIRGAGEDGTPQFPPTVGRYAVAAVRAPVDPNTATLQFNLSPSGTLRGVSGVVEIEAIEGTDVTFSVDAALEDGTPVRGRLTLGLECR